MIYRLLRFKILNINSMYVYIMKCANYYKIGHSKNPDSRRSTIQTHNPLDVKICALLKTQDFLETEKNLHSYFSTKKSRGEWFELEESDLITLKVDFGFEFKIKIGLISKSSFDNSKEQSETKKFRLNNLDLENAILHFENLFNCNIVELKKIKTACIKYDINIVMNSILNLFNRDYEPNEAYNKLLSFCKYEQEKINNPVSYLSGIIRSIYNKHYEVTLNEQNLINLENRLNGIENVDDFLKTINSKKFYLDFQEFWDKLDSFIIKKIEL